MAAISVSLKSKGSLKALVDKLQKDMKGSHVKVGVLATAPARENDEDGGPASNLEVAIYNEFGAPEAGVPERSFLRASFLKHKPEYVQHLETLLKQAVEKGYPIKKGLGIIGLKATSDVKAFITQGEQVPPPNAPATVRQKVERGRWKIEKDHRESGTPVAELEAAAAANVRTLVDTGQLVNSLTHEVVMGGGKES
jgi:hypothetical protein